MNKFNKITTSRRQGQLREGLSEGSLSAKLRVHGQKRHKRPGFRGESAQDDKTRGIANQGKWRDCATKVCILIRGDLNHLLHNGEKAKVQQGNWRIKPGLNKPLSFVESESDSRLFLIFSAYAGNRMSDGSEVSRGHSSRSAGVMSGAGRRAEHSSRRSLMALRIHRDSGGKWRNLS
jgi:hypothetical protein